MERNSEKQLTWAVVGIIGAQVLGVDVQQIISLITEAQQHAAHVNSQAGGLLSGDISLPALVGVYVWRRIGLKEKREATGAEQ